MKNSISNRTHRRKNILTGEWVLVSPNRTKRPWNGEESEASSNELPVYDKGCYLCPGNERAGGKRNEDYENTFVFVNDFSSLTIDTPKNKFNKNDFLIAETEAGISKVICFTPNHNLTLAELPIKKIKKVIDTWYNEYLNIGKLDNINYVQIFENKGEIMGCSNRHPHGQIWAQQSIPDIPAKESHNFQKYYEDNRTTLLSDYLKLEMEENERIVTENEHFVSLVPFWAVWPFETMIISRRSIQSILEMTEDEKESLAQIIKIQTTKYDNIFKIPFPYSSGIHQAPTDGKEHPEWHFHIHFYPPLLRSATIKKFMVGYEMLANPQRDITAEYSAKLLKEMSIVHYKEGIKAKKIQI